MAYEFTGIIAAEQLLRARMEWSETRVVPIRRGLAVVPLPWDVERQLDGRFGFDLVDGRELRAWLAVELARWSQDAPVAYAKAAFHSGLGGQWACVWRGGHRISTIERSLFAPGAYYPPTPISQALSHLGIGTDGLIEGVVDEFEVAGLGRHRTSEQWLAP